MQILRQEYFSFIAFIFIFKFAFTEKRILIKDEFKNQDKIQYYLIRYVVFLWRLTKILTS